MSLKLFPTSLTFLPPKLDWISGYACCHFGNLTHLGYFICSLIISASEFSEISPNLLSLRHCVHLNIKMTRLMGTYYVQYVCCWDVFVWFCTSKSSLLISCWTFMQPLSSTSIYRPFFSLCRFNAPLTRSPICSHLSAFFKIVLHSKCPLLNYSWHVQSKIRCEVWEWSLFLGLCNKPMSVHQWGRWKNFANEAFRVGWSPGFWLSGICYIC